MHRARNPTTARRASPRRDRPCHVAFAGHLVDQRRVTTGDADGLLVGVEGSGVDVAATFRDGAAPPGRHAYWLRITQIDGAKAWLSPWCVTIE